MNKEDALKELKILVERYNQYKDDKDFIANEKQICESLIKPFIKKVLGWNIEDFSEFKVEYPERGKRIDMVICLDGISQFVIEAKALTKDIIDNREYYTQAINYAYSKDKTFAILTNFKHWIVLRCDITVPFPERASIGNIDLTNFEQERFDKLVWNFSKGDWIKLGDKNSLYSQLGNLKKKRPIDEQLLEDMKNWRVSLLTNLRKYPRKNHYDFDNEKDIMHVEEEIQRLIDRLIFICYCEDRELNEPQLKSLKIDKYERFSGKPFLLEKIREIFYNYRKEYNSDLFNVGMCDGFFFDDSVLYTILEDLMEPKGKIPYDFASIEVDILGRTYENFIGHLIKGKKRFKEEKSRGKRKAEGIYYTPQYIVNYIINHTLREYIKNKGYEEIKKIKILDPACGSGSFLLKAFDVLLEECQNRLNRKLLYKEKEELLLNCIYGVDKDERACDIAKLNLSLKLAERGEKLPELHNNIRNGDSLIDNKEVVDYLAFNWDKEFSEIIKNGGFDIVIGNPPYIRQEKLGEMKNQFEKDYECYMGTADIYVYFYERGIKLLKQKGMLGFITSNKWMKVKYGYNLRRFLKNFEILEIIDFFELNVFGDAATEPCIVILKKEKNLQNKVFYALIEELKPEKLPEYIKNNKNIFNRNDLDNNGWNLSDTKSTKILDKLKDGSIRLLDYVNGKIFYGIKTGFNKAFILNEEQAKMLLKDNLSKPYIKKYLAGIDIKRYFSDYKGEYMIVVKDGEDLNQNSKVFKYLNQFKKELNKRYDKGSKWYQLRPCKYYEEFSKPKIMFIHTAKQHNFQLDYRGYFLNNSCYFIPIEDKFLVAYLNSKLFKYYKINTFVAFGDARTSGRCKLDYNKMVNVPIKIPKDHQREEITKLVDKIIDLKRKIHKVAKESYEYKKIEKEINETNEQIDKEIYEIFGLQDSEIETIKST